LPLSCFDESAPMAALTCNIPMPSLQWLSQAMVS
jgi:hypothetical protein